MRTHLYFTQFGSIGAQQGAKKTYNLVAPHNSVQLIPVNFQNRSLSAEVVQMFLQQQLQ